MTLSTVAPGRTIWAHPDPGVAAAFSPFMFQAPPTIANPGDSIDLSDDDFARCLASGTIVNPAVQVVPGPGGSTQLIPG